MLSFGATGQFRDFDYIEKTGTGALTLSGNGSGFTGTMLVKDGRLVVNSDSGTSAVTVYGGAALSRLRNGRHHRHAIGFDDRARQ